MDKIHSSIKRSLEQKNKNLYPLSLGLSLLIISLWLIFVYFQYYQDRFYPNTYIDDVNLSGLKKTEAKEKLQKSLKGKIDFSTDSLVLFYQDKKIETKLKDLEINNNLNETLEKSFESDHSITGIKEIKRLIFSNFYANRNYVGLSYNKEKIVTEVENLKKSVDFVGEKPSVNIVGKNININKGKTSNELLVDETWQTLHQQFLSKNLRDLSGKDLEIEAIVKHSISSLEDGQLETSENRVKKFIDKKLTLKYEYQKIEIEDDQLINFLLLPKDFDQETIVSFIEKLKQGIDRPSKDAAFIYDQNSLKVEEFVPDENGLEVDEVATKKIIEDFLNQIENDKEGFDVFALPMQSSQAQKTLEKTNNLGIKEVIGFGESWYYHSIPNRISNVALAASRITNHIVKPGEEFSFNDVIGEVSDKTGYKSAYIIEGGQTKLAPGGGVCQVSSTLFRSLLNAGLEITRRLPHAYRVSYYEIGNEPGFDATVFEDDIDLRFVNDTDSHILINCQTNSKDLYMFCKIYGTSDGRHTEIVDYKKWGQTPALPTIYIPDPSLKPGQLKQIDWSAAGIKSEFTNIIYDKDNQIVRKDVYKSNYRPWAAKFLQGI